MSKGKIIIIMLIAGVILGFGGWITSESAAVTTVAAANHWIVVAVIGAVLAVTSLALLAAGWGRGQK